MKFIGNGG
ncbi:hypothetical protein VCHC21A1_1442, partial [Vibrio cholerae HC-21A1]